MPRCAAGSYLLSLLCAFSFTADHVVGKGPDIGEAFLTSPEGANWQTGAPVFVRTGLKQHKTHRS